MWEYRLIWMAKPPWWSEVWSRGVATLRRRGREPESRPDLYIVVPERVDLGLKLRGEKEGEFDAKVQHERRDGWELWEKIPYYRWNDLEAARFSAMARLLLPAPEGQAATTPTAGARQVLQQAGLQHVDVRVAKQRIQAAAGDLLAAAPGHSVSPDFLAELVEIRLPAREHPLLSVCVETMEPLPGGAAVLPAEGALCCGYPELLVRHIRGTL